MRFGKWRGVALAIALSSAIAAGWTAPARAHLFHVMPTEMDAVDVNTGGPYMAPPVPYGCYAKDHLGALHNVLGCLRCRLGGLCGGCGGNGCGLCGGKGCGGAGAGDPSGGCGLFGKRACGYCSGSGCGFCRGRGLLGGKGCGDPCGAGGCIPAGTVIASAPAPIPSAQAPIASGQCGAAGCGIMAKHHHRLLGRGRGCGSCGGAGCGLCGGGGGFAGDPCSQCGGRGCGLCGKGMGTGCGACGGRGCGLCKGGHAPFGLARGLVRKALHIGDVKYFVGAGGPVPLTPGYVPYVVVTRSPRDYFAFPPFSDVDP